MSQRFTLGLNDSVGSHTDSRKGRPMSDTSQGQGWWIASDGKWYPPQPGASVAAPPPPGMPPAPMAQPPAKATKKIYKRVWFWLLMGVVVLFGGCIAIVAGGTKAVNDANNQKHTIVYTVTGNGTANITYAAYDNGNTGTSQVGDAPLPWTKTITGSGLFNSYSVIATVGSNGGTVACTLSVDGKKVSSHSASGAYSSADCSGSNQEDTRRRVDDLATGSARA